MVMGKIKKASLYGLPFSFKTDGYLLASRLPLISPALKAA